MSVRKVDKGIQDELDRDGKPFKAYVTEWSAECPRCGATLAGKSVVDLEVAHLGGAAGQFRITEENAFAVEFQRELLEHKGCPKAVRS